MEDIGLLNEAFQNFTVASKSLETYYEKLQEKVLYLTEEVAEKNRQLEKALNDSRRLKELEAHQERNHRLIAMGEMAAKIVHEIRSPLCSIELYASMLARELEGSGHIDLAKGISTGIRSLNNILTNMLFFALPQKPSFRRVSVQKVLEESLFMLMPMIEARGITPDNMLECDSVIQGDPELMKQVFLNIIINAVQVTPEGGEIGISLRKVGDGAVVDVRDGGGGIGRDDMERIFDPFFSTKEKGTGLGLTIASRIMQAHDGLIKVKSSTGDGSCFQLFFPLEGNEAKSLRIMQEGIF